MAKIVIELRDTAQGRQLVARAKGEVSKTDLLRGADFLLAEWLTAMGSLSPGPLPVEAWVALQRIRLIQGDLSVLLGGPTYSHVDDVMPGTVGRA